MKSIIADSGKHRISRKPDNGIYIVPCGVNVIVGECMEYWFWSPIDLLLTLALTVCVLCGKLLLSNSSSPFVK